MLEITFSQYKNFIMLFLFFVISNNFLTVLVVREKIKVKFALAIPTGAPIILVNEISDTPPVVALKNFIYIIKSCNIFNVLLHDFL